MIHKTFISPKKWTLSVVFGKGTLLIGTMKPSRDHPTGAIGFKGLSEKERKLPVESFVNTEIKWDVMLVFENQQSLCDLSKSLSHLYDSFTQLNHLKPITH